MALILESRTLRLQRLDRVNDLADGVTNLAESQLMGYASCWTEAEDCHAMWRLYGDAGRGVRIGIDPRVPPYADVEPTRAFPRRQHLELNPEGISVRPNSRASYRLLLQAHTSGTASDVRPTLVDLQPVTYSSEASDDARHDITGTAYVNAQTGEHAGTHYDKYAIGLLKHRSWQFEREHRYVGVLQDRDVPFLGQPRPHPQAPGHFDIPLREDLFSDSSTTLELGPLAGRGHRSLVESLVRTHVPEFALDRLTQATRRVHPTHGSER